MICPFRGCSADVAVTAGIVVGGFIGPCLVVRHSYRTPAGTLSPCPMSLQRPEDAANLSGVFRDWLAADARMFADRREVSVSPPVAVRVPAPAAVMRPHWFTPNGF